MVGFSKKVVIVVDKDVDPTDLSRVMHAIGTRWQPGTAALTVKQSTHIPIDPSCREMFLSSKNVIEATRQLPEEGGRADFPETNRALLERNAPAVFAEVDRLFGTRLKSWRPG